MQSGYLRAHVAIEKRQAAALRVVLHTIGDRLPLDAVLGTFGSGSDEFADAVSRCRPPSCLAAGLEVFRRSRRGHAARSGRGAQNQNLTSAPLCLRLIDPTPACVVVAGWHRDADGGRRIKDGHAPRRRLIGIKAVGQGDVDHQLVETGVL